MLKSMFVALPTHIATEIPNACSADESGAAGSESQSNVEAQCNSRRAADACSASLGALAADKNARMYGAMHKPNKKVRSSPWKRKQTKNQIKI